MKKLDVADKEIALAEQLDPQEPKNYVKFMRAYILAARGEKENPFYYTYLLSRCYVILGMKDEVLQIIKDGIEKGFEKDYDISYSYALLVNLGGGTAPRSPFQREPDYTSGSLPPFLGRDMKSRPATEGSYSLGFPNDRLPAASRGAYSPIATNYFYDNLRDDPRLKEIVASQKKTYEERLKKYNQL